MDEKIASQLADDILELERRQNMTMRMIAETLCQKYTILPNSEYQGEWGNGKLDNGWYTMPHSKTVTDHSYYNDANGKDLFYHFKNGVMNTEMYKGFLVGNIFKYITRHGKKDESKTIEDLKKARDYLNELIYFEEHQLNVEEAKLNGIDVE